MRGNERCGEAATPDGRRAISVAEAANLLGISRNQAFKAVRRGELPSVRVGRRVLIPLERLEAFLWGRLVSEADAETVFHKPPEDGLSAEPSQGTVPFGRCAS